MEEVKGVVGLGGGGYINLAIGGDIFLLFSKSLSKEKIKNRTLTTSVKNVFPFFSVKSNLYDEHNFIH